MDGPGKMEVLRWLPAGGTSQCSSAESDAGREDKDVGPEAFLSSFDDD